jgi:5-methylcytosine-specific restriction enzyme A
MSRHDHDNWEQCTLCERLVPPHLITQHHLKPVSRGGKAEHKTPLCKPCHKQLHAVFSNAELDDQLHSLELLRASPRLEGFLKWIRKQKADRNFRTIMSNAHPKKRRRR